MEILTLNSNEINQNGYHINKLTRNKIGFIYIAPANIIPDDCLACDGYVLKISDYKKLYSAIGKTYNTGVENDDEFRIPDYNITGEFLQPSTVTNKTIVAGLPNITGYISGDDYKMAQIGGAFYFSGTASGTHQETVSGSFNIVRFDASRSSSIYGRSTTVQPPARTVQICIRYK